jgi:sirohydrochlorin cobaltochelatase
MICQSVLILAHGSRDQGARAEYQRIRSEVARRLPEVPVEFAVLEFAGEGLASISEAVRRCAEAGSDRIVALPYFLFAAGHVRDDLPGELAQAARDWPSLMIAYQPPIGVDRRVIEVLEARANEADQDLAGGASTSGAVLLVGAGTSDPDSNADLFRAARLLWERRQFPLVEVAFVSLTAPSVADGIERCLKLGAPSIAVVPYFLNSGVLSRRIAARLETARQQQPRLRIALASELGLHPTLLDLVADRAQIALAAPHRNGVPLPPCADGSTWACWLAGVGAGQD